MEETIKNNLVKTVTKESKEYSILSELDLPMLLPDEKASYQMFSNKDIGIVDGQIILADTLPSIQS
ncbi:MAG: hypothetical protein GF353_20545 [Candidatus Lokiarchaeota archaeon]|nr:hypothetical protein [Candidatus Lokiarchaeota archaeon]